MRSSAAGQVLVIFLSLIAMGALAGAILATNFGSADATDGLKPRAGEEAVPVDTRLQDMAERQQKLTVTGVRLTQGDAVRCPEIRGDDGMTYPISTLPAEVAIGGRVRVSGTMAYVTTCVGPVLYADDIVALD